MRLSVSHELRNPLSAILQCSDEIVTTLEKYRKTAKADTVEVLGGTVLDLIDAGETSEISFFLMMEKRSPTPLISFFSVYYCCQHQARIADDVLVLSKLSRYSPRAPPPGRKES